MKILKKVFLALALLVMLFSGGVIFCALSPDLTAQMAEIVNEAQSGQSGIQPGAGLSVGQSGQTSSDGGSGFGEGINTGWVENQGNGYVAPEKQPSAPPESVDGRGGYEPVSEELEQIPQEEADNLSDIVAKGELGENLSFDAAFYPYYAMLEPKLQQLYCQIYANAQNLTTSFAPVVEVNVNQVKTVFEAVYNDHPELFWLETGYSCKYLSSGKCVELILKYNDTVNYLDQAKLDFEKGAEAILSGAKSQASAAEQEKYVHDALMEKVEYDENAPMNQSAYSALVTRRSVCAGYARSFQYLMQQLGIPCFYCTGTSGEDHAWNIIKLDDTYFNVDVTWDDTDPATYDYFNKSDSEFAGTHVRTGMSVYLPACGGNASAGDGAVSEDIRGLINQEPRQPLGWESRGKVNSSPTDQATADQKAENLKKAGITEDQVLENLQDYYKDCVEQMKQAGTGEQQFTNVVPESLWPSVETVYANGEYWKGYVEESLKELNAQSFAIQLQAERLGGGYYRLYHTVYTY